MTEKLYAGSEKILRFIVRKADKSYGVPSSFLFTLQSPEEKVTWVYGEDNQIVYDERRKDYTVTIYPLVAGYYAWRCITTGVNAALEGEFKVLASKLG